MKALIKVGYRCNDRCVFCHACEQQPEADTQDRIEGKIDRAAALGHSMVVFSGGEPTIHPGLLRFAERAHRGGLAFGLVTNGRRLADPALVERLLGLGLAYAYVSLHAGEASVHDAIVRGPAFEQTIAGVRNLLGRGIDLTVNCVVSRLNIDHLRSWVVTLAPLEDARLKLSMTEPKGAAWTDFDQVVPTLTEAAQKVAEAIRFGEELIPGRRIFHDGFPLCLLPGLEDRFDDLWTHGFASMSEVFEEDFFPVDDDNKVQPPVCEGCGLQGPCPGLFTGYQGRRGSSELRPRQAPRSNSYNLVPVSRSPWPRSAPCPVRGSTSHLDRSRNLFLRNGERLTLFQTGTRDFSRQELLAVKYHLGQLYVDGSEKAAIDDFASDLFKVEPLDTCRACPDQPSCPGGFRVRREDLFLRDDRIVRDVMAGLRGVVLDVGCGESPYSQILEPLAEASLITYRGVDPNGDLIARLRERWPWAQLQEGRAEDLRPEPGSLDHVTILRSYNHMERPREILPRLVEALRPQGTILIVDNVAFGLLRRPGQARRAEGGDGLLEHLRNASATEPAAILDACGLRLIIRRDVNERTSNQWLLHYRKGAT